MCVASVSVLNDIGCPFIQLKKVETMPVALYAEFACQPVLNTNQVGEIPSYPGPKILSTKKALAALGGKVQTTTRFVCKRNENMTSFKRAVFNSSTVGKSAIAQISPETVFQRCLSDPTMRRLPGPSAFQVQVSAKLFLLECPLVMVGSV